MYDGKIKIDYKDKAHRYYARPRIDFNLPEESAKAWGKVMYPKGTTTLIGDTLEKKGLMQWPKGLALRELFGFYDFKTDDGKQLTGFSKGVGTLRNLSSTDGYSDTELLPAVLSASKAWQRKQKKGADIGTVVHAAIEAYVTKQPFDIAENYMWNIKETEYETDEALEKALEDFEEDVAQAILAFDRFRLWWEETSPVLYGTEDLLYSLEHNICGTYDADLGIKKEHHPRPDMFPDKDIIRCTTDWKTSNASGSVEAAAPEGVYYSYFIQDAIYEMMRREMGLEPADDLLVVSARKDGGFSLVYASELDLTVQDCIDWAMATITCYRFMDKSKAGLLAHAEEGAENVKI